MLGNFFSFLTRFKVHSKQGGKCFFRDVNVADNHCEGTICDFHHIIPKTKPNIAKYGPERIHSEENCVGLCRWCHDNNLYALRNYKMVLMRKWDKELANEKEEGKL